MDAISGSIEEEGMFALIVFLVNIDVFVLKTKVGLLYSCFGWALVFFLILNERNEVAWKEVNRNEEK